MHSSRSHAASVSIVDRPARKQRTQPTRHDLIHICLYMMELRAKGDFRRLAEHLTDDFEMVIPGIPGLNPFAGTTRGRDACLKVMRDHFTLIEFIDLRAVSTVAEGDTVVVNWTCAMRNRGAGPMLQTGGMASFRIRDGKVFYCENRLDSAAIASLAQFSA